MHTTDAPAAPSLLQIAAALGARAVGGDGWARGTLYTWTPVARLAVLRAQRRLLLADASTGGRPSPFSQALARLAARPAPGAALARLLLGHAVLRKRRYAWTAPYATARGLAAGGYGGALIEVVLRPDALLARFDPAAIARGAQPFALCDLSQRPVPLEALAPARLAAVYHVRRGPGAPVAFREYVLCNELAIARWSVATPAIAAQLAAECALLGALASGPPAPSRERSSDRWSQPVDPSAHELGALWDQTLAVDDGRYRPTPDNLRALAATLAAHQRAALGAPIEHTPDGAFDRALVVAGDGVAREASPS